MLDQKPQEMSVEQMLASVISGAGTATAPKKDSPFTSYTVYLNEHYIGNYSLPENFTEGTKEAVLAALKALGLELRAPGSTKRELSLADLGIKA